MKKILLMCLLAFGAMAQTKIYTTDEKVYDIEITNFEVSKLIYFFSDDSLKKERSVSIDFVKVVENFSDSILISKALRLNPKWENKLKTGKVNPNKKKTNKLPSIPDCDFEINEVDEFTKDTVKLIRSNLCLKLARRHDLYIQKVSDYYYLKVTTSTTGIESWFIPKDSELMLMLDNEDIIRVKSLDSYRTEFDRSLNVSSSFIKSTYSIQKEDLSKLLNNKIIKFRIYYEKGYLQEDVNNNKSTEIRRNVRCVLLN